MANSIIQRAARAALGIFGDFNPKATWNLLPGVLPGGLGMPPQRYTRDFLRAYSQMPWLRAAANKIAFSVAQVEWKLYAGKAKPGRPNGNGNGLPANGKPPSKYYRDYTLQRAGFETRKKLIKSMLDVDDLTEIKNHPMLDVLHDANSMQTGLQMRKVTQLHIDLVGEAFWLKERNEMGVVVGVWPIPPDWILNTPTPTNKFFRVGYRAWRGLIPDSEFIWFQDTDPLNPYARGSGVGQSIADELETDEYTAKHTKAFFYNRAKPDLLIFPKSGNIREPDIKRIETDWMQSNQGFWRAFKPYFMTREVGVHEMDQNFRAMQLVQLRQFERDVIIQTFGIPPEMLGILTHSNRSTINAASYLMGRYIVQPRLEFIRTILQAKFAPVFDVRIFFDFESPVDEDHEAEEKSAAAFPWCLNIDEQRALCGLDPLDDEKEGKLHVMPSNYAVATLSDVAAQTQEAHEAAIAPKPGPIIVAPDGKPAPNQPGLNPKPGQPKPGQPASGTRPGSPAPKPGAPKPPAPKPVGPGGIAPGGGRKLLEEEAGRHTPRRFPDKKWVRR